MEDKGYVTINLPAFRIAEAELKKRMDMAESELAKLGVTATFFVREPLKLSKKEMKRIATIINWLAECEFLAPLDE